MLLRRIFLLLLPLVLGALGGCQAGDPRPGAAPSGPTAEQVIRTETPGDYFIGRRFYKVDYRFWGYVRRPGQPWSSAKLVMLNEQQKLAPDRESGHIGSDNGYEYKLQGEFSGQTVYEPASNGFYPEFILKSAELKSVAPPSIFHTPGATDPTRRIIAKPY